MKIQCDVCEKAPATVICCADEAALCDDCDVQVHAANKLASKHERLLLNHLSTKQPMCDVCQEKPAFIFCVEDRALFCRDCDESIHVEGSLSGDHQRLLATGISVALRSACRKMDSTKQKGSTTKLTKKNSVSKNSSLAQTTLEMPMMSSSSLAQTPSQPSRRVPLHQTPTDYTTSTWSVDEFLQLSDYESGDKKGSTSDFGGLDWFAGIDVFPDDMSNDSLAAAEVPEMRYLPVPNNPPYFNPAKSGSVLKKPRIEISDDEEFFIVPDLG